MKNKSLKIITIILLIFAILVFLWHSLVLYLGSKSVNREISINNNNLDIIDNILSQSIDTYNEIPDISNATKIEYVMLFYKDKITIYYENSSAHTFYIKGGYENAFIEYIIENGNSLYLGSMEFVCDLLKFGFSFIVTIICIVILNRIRQSSQKFN